jgi:hypothetical protein
MSCSAGFLVRVGKFLEPRTERLVKSLIREFAVTDSVPATGFKENPQGNVHECTLEVHDEFSLGKATRKCTQQLGELDRGELSSLRTKGRENLIIRHLVNSTSTLSGLLVTIVAFVNPYRFAIVPVNVLKAASSAGFRAVFSDHQRLVPLTMFMLIDEHRRDLGDDVLPE